MMVNLASYRYLPRLTSRYESLLTALVHGRAAALAMMEQATGMRFAKAVIPFKPPTQAVDAV